jgi:tRNA(fMet)-specific endonuclease VapC
VENGCGRRGQPSALWSVGKPIEAEDVLIGASVLSRGLTVVTHNVNHFRRIPGLKVEDWLTS